MAVPLRLEILGLRILAALRRGTTWMAIRFRGRTDLVLTWILVWFILFLVEIWSATVLSFPFAILVFTNRVLFVILEDIRYTRTALLFLGCRLTLWLLLLSLRLRFVRRVIESFFATVFTVVLARLLWLLVFTPSLVI